MEYTHQQFCYDVRNLAVKRLPRASMERMRAETINILFKLKTERKDERLETEAPILLASMQGMANGPGVVLRGESFFFTHPDGTFSSKPEDTRIEVYAEGEGYERWRTAECVIHELAHVVCRHSSHDDSWATACHTMGLLVGRYAGDTDYAQENSRKELLDKFDPDMLRALNKLPVLTDTPDLIEKLLADPHSIEGLDAHVKVMLLQDALMKELRED